MVKFSKDYININKKAYDKLAFEYNKRSTENIRHQEAILGLFEQRLLEQFNRPIRILDVGCGVGVDSLILSIHGFRVHGIDISGKMLSYAKKNAQFASFEQVNFLQKKKEVPFNGILMDAFIHLFPRDDTDLVLEKTKSLICPKGIVLVSTTFSGTSKEGYFEKFDYNKKVQRFRRFWTKDELIGIFEKKGFKLLDYYLDYQQRWGKDWMNFIFQLG